MGQKETLEETWYMSQLLVTVTKYLRIALKGGNFTLGHDFIG